MSDRVDESLFESPLPPPRRQSHWLVWLVGVVFVGVVVAAVVFTTLSVRDETSAAGDTSTSEPPGGSTTATTSVSTLPLKEYIADTALLYYPTLLPQGWELCRQLEEIDSGDRFCDPGHPDAWLQIAVKDSFNVRLDRGQPTGDAFGGVSLERGDRIEVAYPIAQFHTMVIASEGLSESDVLKVAATIPFVAERSTLHGSYELPLDLDTVSDDHLAALMTWADPEPRVAGRAGGNAQVFAGNLSLLAFEGPDYSVPDLAPTIWYPRLIDADRPVVAGESPSRGRAVAIWDQRGCGWRLEGPGSATEMAALATDMIERIAQPPDSLAAADHLISARNAPIADRPGSALRCAVVRLGLEDCGCHGDAGVIARDVLPPLSVPLELDDDPSTAVASSVQSDRQPNHISSSSSTGPTSTSTPSSMTPVATERRRGCVGIDEHSLWVRG